MGRKKKFVNKTHYPDWAIERFTRCIFDDVLVFFASEEGQKEYENWESEQERMKKAHPEDGAYDALQGSPVRGAVSIAD